ncbi:UDP-3-O-(3-hydroxymyristoyl)glucosamine N-acyltransferase [Kerstersia gyiorum]|uniref:UDP-3-O-(3-hydroxymyristoyl)glucosamine N-acyltransferase n=1 Tax=Kerstersia gyiorum TaxID=206506 RepID=UPI003B43B954
MPLLLDEVRAPSLSALFAEVDAHGLPWRLETGGAEEPRIAGLAPLTHAGANELSFLSNHRYLEQLSQSGAGAVILPAAAAAGLPASVPFARVICEQPYLLYARVAQWFDRARRAGNAPCVHPSAIVAEDAVIEADVDLGPFCVVESGAVVKRGSIIGAGCVIGARSVVGEDSLLYPRVVLYSEVRLGARAIVHSGAVLGADGFGFAPDPTRGGWSKIPQFGGVVVGNDVEIGANTTIDRGALDDTVIADGVKLDNQIMVAHNVHIGMHTAIAACVGIAGSTHIGARCTIGGASMISGHLVLGDDVHVSGGTAVTSSITKPGRYTGVYPYAEHGEWQRNAAVIQQLGSLRRRVRALEKD